MPFGPCSKYPIFSLRNVFWYDRKWEKKKSISEGAVTQSSRSLRTWVLLFTSSEWISHSYIRFWVFLRGSSGSQKNVNWSRLNFTVKIYQLWKLTFWKKFPESKLKFLVKTGGKKLRRNLWIIFWHKVLRSLISNYPTIQVNVTIFGHVTVLR